METKTCKKVIRITPMKPIKEKKSFELEEKRLMKAITKKDPVFWLSDLKLAAKELMENKYPKKSIEYYRNKMLLSHFLEFLEKKNK